MTNEDFITLVESMRSEQKRYFKAVSNSFEKYDALDKSKKKEKEVDKAITSYREKGSFSDPQTALFE